MVKRLKTRLYSGVSGRTKVEVVGKAPGLKYGLNLCVCETLGLAASLNQDSYMEIPDRRVLGI